MNAESDTPPTPEEIALCAYLIWVQEGRPDGIAAQHWLQAEAQLLAAYQHDRTHFTKSPNHYRCPP